MALGAPRNSLAVGHCGNPGGLRHRLNLSLRGPRNDDPSRERSINFALRETEIFRPSKVGAIVGSLHRGPCADKQRVRGRTAPPVPTTSVVPLIRCADLRCTQVLRRALSQTGKVCAHSRYRDQIEAPDAGSSAPRSLSSHLSILEPRRQMMTRTK